MESASGRKHNILFFSGIVAAGIAHTLERVVLTLLVKYGEGRPAFFGAPYLSTLGFCVNLSIYVFLLIWWINSLRRRLLPTRARTYLICSAVLMIFYLALRSAKYRLADTSELFSRILWYLYYIPLIFIPTLFLATCVFMWKKGGSRRFDERILLIPASVMTLLVLTNDLHNLVFVFPYDELLTGSQNTYIENAGYYIVISCMILAFVCGMILLTSINRAQHSVKKVLAPFAFLLILGVLIAMEKAFGHYNLPRPFNPPEIVVFCMLGILENCVRNRLIPHNENYVGFWNGMSVPAVITDRRFAPVYRTAVPVDASADRFEAALDSPVYLDPDTRLYGSGLSAGYAFYTEDEGELHRLNEQLAEANELLASENELIRAENELKEKMARVESRNRIYSRVSGAMLRRRARLAELLSECEKEGADVRAILARVCLTTAYIKRASGMLLSGEDGAPTDREIPSETLSLALEESARYLPYCGIKPMVVGFEGGSIPLKKAFALYSAFEDVCEAIIGDAGMMTVSVTDGVMRIIADCASPPEVNTEGVGVGVEADEGMYYITVRYEEGGIA